MITWYVAYTQPHGEAKALDHLRRQDYVLYLPRYRRFVRHARKRALVLRPLFPRYLFVGLDRRTQRWRPIRSTQIQGDAVRVTEGPFENLIGRLLSVADHERVFILLDLLGRSVRAEVPAAAVEAA